MSDQTIFDAPPLERVRERMTVIDHTGTTIGTVQRVRMGDPQAVSVHGDDPGSQEGIGLAPAPASTSGSTTTVGAVPVFGSDEFPPNIPDALRTSLRRGGYIEIEGATLDGAERYIAGDRIREVTANTVRLRPPATQTTTSTAVPAAEGREAVATASGEPMFRTRVGTPRTIGRSVEGAMPRFAWALGGGGAATGAASLLGIWLYRRRKQQNQPRARIRRAYDAVAARVTQDDRARLSSLAGLLITLVTALMVRQARGTQTADGQAFSSAARNAREFRVRRRRPPIGVVVTLGAVVACIGLLRRRSRPARTDRYIGTPGVESAAGRERTRSGELPPDFGVEHVHR